MDLGVVDQAGHAEPRQELRLELGQHRLAALDPIDRDIDPVEHAAVGGSIGAEAGGIGGEQGMERVQADEIGAGGSGNVGKSCEIGEVANAEIACRAQAVELAAHAPDTLMIEP